MFFEQFESTLCVVERENDDVVDRGGGGAVGDRDTIGAIGIAPDGGVGDLTHLGVVVSAVVRPFDFGNLGASGESSRSFDGHHHRFGA